MTTILTPAMFSSHVNMRLVCDCRDAALESNFIPTWICRGSRSLVTRPNALLLKLVLMPAKLVWLRMLNASPRSCAFRCCLT